MKRIVNQKVSYVKILKEKSGTMHNVLFNIRFNVRKGLCRL